MSFSRVLPKVTAFAEKPMARWASGKIKKIYDGYGAFCEEIENLLGEPQTKPHVSEHQTPSNMDDFDLLWEGKLSRQENALQLLTVLSSFYKAGFVISGNGVEDRIVSYFAEESLSEYSPVLAQPFKKFMPEFTGEMKPAPISVSPIMERLSLQTLDWDQDVVFHFWLDPEASLSLVVVADEKLCGPSMVRETLLKTQALIQRRFYD